MDIIKNSLRNIFRNKLRSGLTITGIAIGVLSVIIISAIGDLGTRTINSELSSVGIGGLAVSASKSAVGVSVGTEDLQVVNQYDYVDASMPVTYDYTSARLLDTTSSCVLFGIDEDADKLVSLEVLYGRLVTKNDLVNKSKVCVVDENFAKKIYKRSNIVGKTLDVLVGGVYEPFEIVGVVASGGNVVQNLMGNYIPCFIYAPYSTVQLIAGKSGFDQIMIRLKDGIDSGAACSRLRAQLEARNGVKNSITIENLVEQKQQLNGILNIITSVLSIIAAISLVVAGLSIMTVMLVTVHERTREIGIKKSIGASKRKIVTEFIAESFFLCLIGGAIGCMLGVALVFAGCWLAGIVFYINLKMIAFCIAFATLTGVVFGVYPAFKAAKLKPVDALRFE